MINKEEIMNKIPKVIPFETETGTIKNHYKIITKDCIILVSYDSPIAKIS